MRRFMDWFTSPVKNTTNIALVGLLLIGIAVWSVQHQGQDRLRDSQRSGCERSKKDRAANAHGWRTAEQARRMSGTPNDLEAAAKYARIADGLEARSRIDCTRAFP